jgi:predicted dienelactone hydrolase
MTAESYASQTGPSTVVERHDVMSGHPVLGAYQALTCRWPQERDPLGIVVFCHGLGSSGREYAELSSHWARHGYFVIHPTFADSIQAVARAEPQLDLDPGSDLSKWSAIPAVHARMHQILHTPSYWLMRIELVLNVLDAFDEIAAATCGVKFAQIPIAVAGHSFGAYAAQLLAGAEIDLPDGRTGRFREARVRAAVLLSAQGRNQQGLRDNSWNSMSGPVLTVTGTLDRGANGGDWRWKSEPFELSPVGGKYLMVLDDSDHFLGGFSKGTGQRQVLAQQEAVRQVTLAFLDAQLRESRDAREWLNSVKDRVAGCPVLFKSK